VVIFRLATASDAATIACVHVETWRRTYRRQMPDSVLDGLDAKFTPKSWVKLLQASESTTFVADVEKEIIGFCSLMPSRDPEADKKIIAEIAAINISPRHWRKGAGRKLCEHAIAEAQSNGFSSLTLWVLETNHAARKFYVAIGFALDGGQKTIAMGGVDLLEVRYRLTLLH